MDRLIGHSLGRYHIVEQLGEGGMASVFKAYDTALERFVAIKVIRTDRSHNEAFLLRFQREAKALARLDHPFILKVLDYNEQDGVPYLVMPLVTGGTLKDHLGQPIPMARATAILAPIARALEYAHEQNVIHRDIKPANILLGPTGMPLLSDFGIAKMLDQEGSSTQITATGVGIGTPDYMAPEQWMGQADQRTDVYSLGIVLYEMVTGRRPFAADTPAAVLLKHVQDPLPRPRSFVPDLPVEVERVLFKALAKNPADRYQTVGELAAVLESLASGTFQFASGQENIQTRIDVSPLEEAAAPPPLPEGEAASTLPDESPVTEVSAAESPPAQPEEGKVPVPRRSLPVKRISGIVSGIGLVVLLLVVAILFRDKWTLPDFTSRQSTPTRETAIQAATAVKVASPTVAPLPCDEVQLIADVTVPHGAEMPPGEPFSKTWRLRNTGSCAWDTRYALVFVEGAPLNAPEKIDLPRKVQPGEIVEVSIEMKAPGEPGHYLSAWKLRNPSGQVIGAAPDTVFIVEIIVAQPEPVRISPRPVGEVCSNDPRGCAIIAPEATVKIGMGAPLSGDDAHYGVDISQGARIAISDGGDILGWRLELVVLDDGGTPQGGEEVAMKLASDPGVIAIAGHVFSASTATAIPVYERAGLPMMSPSATSQVLSDKGGQVFNRITYTDEVQGRIAAEYLFHQLGVRKLAILHEEQSYGQGLAGAVRQRFEQLGGKVIAIEPIPPGRDEYDGPLSIVAAQSPQAVYFAGYLHEAVVLANQWVKSGLEGVTFFGCDGTYGIDFINRTGANGEGVYAVGQIPPPSDAVQRFNEIYQREYGLPAGSLSPFTWNSYDAAAVLIAAIKKVAFIGEDGFLYIPRSELVMAVRGTRDFPGLSGPITCNPAGECNASGPIFYVVRDGKWEIAETE